MAKGKKTGGRRPGSLNKTTRTVRESILTVFRELGDVESMRHWAKENQTAFYQIYARLIPQEHSGPEGGPIPIAVHDHFDSPPPPHD